MAVELLILADSEVASAALKADPGLAILVSGPGRKVLFDTAAQPEALLANARTLQVDLRTLDAAIISHGHCDHTGGLAAVAALHGRLTLYAHPGIFARRWLGRAGEPLADISCPHSPDALRRAGVTFHEVTSPEMLTDWMILSGRIGGPKHGSEVFVVRAGDEMVVDGFEDENILMVRAQQGWALISGCCHRGLKNTLRTARFLVHDEPITAVVGGMHLETAGDEELAQAVELFSRLGSPELYPCHCTGSRAGGFLESKLPGKVHPVKAGARIVF